MAKKRGKKIKTQVVIRAGEEHFRYKATTNSQIVHTGNQHDFLYLSQSIYLFIYLFGCTCVFNCFKCLHVYILYQDGILHTLIS